MKRIRLSIGSLLAFGCFWGWILAEEFPTVKKDQARGTLEGYELLHVYPQLQFPDTASSPIIIDWELGPDMPLPVKGGVAGVLNGHLVIAPGIGIREHDAAVQALDLQTFYTTGVVARDRGPGRTRRQSGRSNRPPASEDEWRGFHDQVLVYDPARHLVGPGSPHALRNEYDPSYPARGHHLYHWRGAGHRIQLQHRGRGDDRKDQDGGRMTPTGWADPPSLLHELRDSPSS